MQFLIKFPPLYVTVASVAIVTCSPGRLAAQTPQASAPTAQAESPRRSSLPEAALKQAREAEQHLAANEPDKAIAILQNIDKTYPDHSAISLRLAQINDTLNRSGQALFYYRRYVQLAGPGARELAVARVASLELMPGIDDDAEKIAKELGEATRPVATPVPKVQHRLSTRAKDGGFVPIENEEDFNRIQKQGVPLRAPSTPIPTPEPAIVLPDNLAPATTPVATTAEATRQPASQENSAQRPVVSAAATPRSPDEDALLAQAFQQADSPGSITASLATKDEAPGAALTPEPLKVKVAKAEVESTPQPRSTPPPAPARPPRLTPAAPVRPDAIAYTSQTPSSNSPRAANFFNVTSAPGGYAQVALINEIPNAVVTLTITPKDNGEAVSGILMSGETKTLFVKPGKFDVSANVSTTDYSPITLMNTNFEYSFAGSRQYTHRFNKTTVQQLN